MALRKLESRDYGRKWLMSIKYQNLHSFKEGFILLCQSILETRRITHLHSSAYFTIPLIKYFKTNILSHLEKESICSTQFNGNIMNMILPTRNIKTFSPTKIKSLLFKKYIRKY